MKVLEQSGVPLSLSFPTRFPLDVGCSKGTKCQICDNKGVKCAPSGVIYRARCKLCKERTLHAQMEGKIDNKETVKTADTHIGESSRPLRERVAEHMDNLWSWKEKSFQICHWMECHATDTSCPKFEFEILKCYSDPLRRQLFEALSIMDQGTLNRRLEFNTNEITRMESTKTCWEVESCFKREQDERQVHKMKIKSFIKTMSAVAQCDNNKKIDCDSMSIPAEALYDTHNISRFNTKKRKRTMDTSTPLASRYRQVETIALDDSSIDSPGAELSSSISLELDEYEHGGENREISCRMDGLKVTPVKSNTSSQLEKELVGGAGDLSSAAKRGGVLKRSSSLPGTIRMVLMENSFFSNFTRAEAMDDHIQVGGANVELRTRSQSEGDCKMEVSVSPGKFIKTKEEEEVMVGREQASPGETISMTLPFGSRASPTLLESKATPGTRLSKRQLNISPQTPRGGPRKLSVCEGASPPLRECQGRTRSYSLTFFYEEEESCVSERDDRRPAASGLGQSELIFGMNKKEDDRRPAAIGLGGNDIGNRRPTADVLSLDNNDRAACLSEVNSDRAPTKQKSSRGRGKRIAARLGWRGKEELKNQRLITAMLTPNKASRSANVEDGSSGVLDQ